MTVEARPETRTPLSRERVMAAAVELADRDGLESLSMRKLGAELGVEAMSLYNHVKNKEDLLDGIVESIVGRISTEVPTGGDWKDAMRERILEARAIMLEHKWVPRLIETRTSVGPSVMVYVNSILGIFRMGGFSYDLAHHALHALGSRTMGFSQELFEPDDPQAAAEDGEQMMADLVEHIPYIAGMLSEISHDDGPDDTIGWCDDQTEFVFALDLILDGLEAKRDAEAG